MLLCRYSWENTKKIKEYISKQLQEDKLSEQLTLEYVDTFMGETVKKGKQ